MFPGDVHVWALTVCGATDERVIDAWNTTLTVSHVVIVNDLSPSKKCRSKIKDKFYISLVCQCWFARDDAIFVRVVITESSEWSIPIWSLTMSMLRIVWRLSHVTQNVKWKSWRNGGTIFLWLFKIKSMRGLFTTSGREREISDKQNNR